jgi:hypothetical protein
MTATHARLADWVLAGASSVSRIVGRAAGITTSPPSTRGGSVNFAVFARNAGPLEVGTVRIRLGRACKAYLEPHRAGT